MQIDLYSTNWTDLAGAGVIVIAVYGLVMSVVWLGLTIREERGERRKGGDK